MVATTVMARALAHLIPVLLLPALLLLVPLLLGQREVSAALDKVVRAPVHLLLALSLRVLSPPVLPDSAVRVRVRVRARAHSPPASLHLAFPLLSLLLEALTIF
jgi:hypothetical protein